MAERKNSAGMLVAAGIATVAGTSFMLGAAVVSIWIARDDGAGAQRAEAIAAPYITLKQHELPAVAPMRAEGNAPSTGAQGAPAAQGTTQTQDASQQRITERPVTSQPLALPAVAFATEGAAAVTTGAQAAAPTGKAGEAAGLGIAPDPAADVGPEPRPSGNGSAAMVAAPAISDAATRLDASPAASDADQEAAAEASPGAAAQPADPAQPRAEAALAELTPDRYLVQVGAFIDKPSAQRLVDRLDAEFAPDCPASIEQRPGRPVRVWWIVTLCPQPDRSAAGEMAGRVARSLDIRPLVRRAGAAP